MNSIDRTISGLLKVRRNLDDAIAMAEAARTRETAKAAMPPRQPKRRGRKSMGEEERREVSKRMTKYWARQRAAAARYIGIGQA